MKRDRKVFYARMGNGNNGMTKGEQTRQRLVAEAAGLFNRRGYEGSSMQDIMQATGLQKGGVYRHFGSKEELAQQAFDYAWHETFEARLKNLDAIDNALDRLKQFVANFVEIRPPVPGGCPLLNTAVEADDGNTALRKRALAALRAWRSALVRIVQSGINRGEIAKTTQPECVATIVIASLEGALMMSRLERNGDHLITVQKHLNAYLESSVRA
jgi:TetR/AcrR family transcriptional repressor of nem operon